jgi:O-antigen ligase
MKFTKNFVIFLLGLLAVGFLYSMAAISFAIYSVAFIMLILWTQQWVKSGSPQKFWPKLGPDKFLWLYWLVVGIGGYTVSIIPANEHFEVASQGVWIPLFYCLTAALIYFDIDESTYETVFIWALIPAALQGIYQSLTGDDWFKHTTNYGVTGSTLLRAKGFSHNPMTYGHLLAVLLAALIPFLLFRVFKTRPKIEKVLWLAVSLGGIALLLTFTRGAWVAVAAQGVVVLLLWNYKHALKIFGAAILVGGVLMATSPAFSLRMHSIGDSHDESTEQRMQLWKSNWHMFLDHPWLGIGAGRTQEEVEAYNIRLDGHSLIRANTHNNLLHVLAGTGIFGFIFWLIAYTWFFIEALRNYWRAMTPATKALHLGCVGAIIAFQIGGLTQTTFDDSEVRMILCFWMAMSIARARRDLQGAVVAPTEAQITKKEIPSKLHYILDGNAKSSS